MDDIFPQVLFTIGGIPVRDTVVSTWIMTVSYTHLTLPTKRIV